MWRGAAARLCGNRKMRNVHDVASRIDKALAEPAVFIEDPARAALLPPSAANLSECSLWHEDEWLTPAGGLDAARGKEPRGPANEI